MKEKLEGTTVLGEVRTSVSKGDGMEMDEENTWG